MTDVFEPAADVASVPNFRDAGAGLLRSGVLYRSGSLNALTGEDAERLGRIGLRTVIDLRTPLELSVWPDRRHELDFEAVHLPLFPDRDGTEPEGIETLYPYMAEVGGAAIAGVVRRVAAAGGAPVLVHCAVGKDRTGLTVAVIQLLAGLGKAEVVADYVHSNARLGLDKGRVVYLDENGEEQVSNPVRAELLLAGLARIHDLHGSIPAYLRAHGVTDAQLDAARAALAG